MDKRFLEECLTKGMSLKAIARAVGRPPGTVGYWVRKHGLRANGSQKFDPSRKLDAQRLKPLVEQGLSLNQIAERTETCSSTVRNAIIRHGLGPTGPMRRAQLTKAARANGLGEIELTCPKHGLTQFWVGKEKVRCRKCNAEGVVQRRRKVKLILVREAGGCRQLCGYDRSPVALEFHHLDPKKKSFAVSHAGISKSLESLRKEAAKCILLCANCHAEVEAGFATPPVE